METTSIRRKDVVDIPTATSEALRGHAGRRPC